MNFVHFTLTVHFVKGYTERVASVSRREREKAEFREDVLNAARAIVFKEGFDALTMRKIAEAIEYSPGTIYLYFESRDAIALELCEQGFQDLLRALGPAAAIADPVKRLEKIGELYVAFGMEHPETYRLIFMEDPKFSTPTLDLDSHEDSPGGQALGFLVKAFDELKAAKRLEEKIDSEQLAETFWAAMHGIVSLKLTCPEFPRTPTDALTQLMSHVLFNGILE